MSSFTLKAPFSLSGDQPQAVEKLVAGIADNKKYQVLLGVTGSGKTFTMAHVIAQTHLPTLVLSPNKTLAAQLYQEFREFFPDNGVGYFVSYYDYYQPEAYVPQTDTYVAKEADINQEIDRLRLEATSLLFSRPDTIIIASVSAIYNLGSPLEYHQYVISLTVSQKISLEEVAKRLVSLQYARTRGELIRGTFRLRGDTLELYPAYREEVIRLTIDKDQLVALSVRPPLTGAEKSLNGYLIYPAKHYLTDSEKLQPAIKQIKQDLQDRLKFLRARNKLVEAQRLEQRVKYDLAMITQTGYVNGIENYSRYFDGRSLGDRPWTLLDYFGEAYRGRFLTVIDESHVAVPQLRGMYQGDLTRKKTLIDFGFRLPSCLDNRPLRFVEILPLLPTIIFASATPSAWEINQVEGAVVEQLVRPTGLIDPVIEVRPTRKQVQDLTQEILHRQAHNERVLVTTLTKKMAEDLAFWLAESNNTGQKIKVQYLHADVKTLERSDILTSLRAGEYDVLVGVNLLREGLDLPEVSLVVILDADKQGFLRSKTALIQTMGRAARHLTGKVILYADEISLAMKEAIEEVERRRQYQVEFNRQHKITPRSIAKPIRARLVEKEAEVQSNFDPASLTPKERQGKIRELRHLMRQAAAELDFEKAIKLRDSLNKIADF